MIKPEWMEESDWKICEQQIKMFDGTVTLFDHNDELLAVTWDYHIWWWDPVDGCFMPTNRLGVIS